MITTVKCFSREDRHQREFDDAMAGLLGLAARRFRLWAGWELVSGLISQGTFCVCLWHAFALRRRGDAARLSAGELTSFLLLINQAMRRTRTRTRTRREAQQRPAPSAPPDGSLFTLFLGSVRTVATRASPSLPDGSLYLSLLGKRFGSGRSCIAVASVTSRSVAPAPAVPSPSPLALKNCAPRSRHRRRLGSERACRAAPQVRGLANGVKNAFNQTLERASAVERVLAFVERAPRLVGGSRTVEARSGRARRAARHGERRRRISLVRAEFRRTGLATSRAEVRRRHSDTRVIMPLKCDHTGGGCTCARDRELSGAVRFERVCFAYPTRPAARVLRGLSFEMAPGRFVALVGPSGGGKTTVASLLVRLYDPTGGRIVVDGVDLREVAIPSSCHPKSCVEQTSPAYGVFASLWWRGGSAG